MEVDSKTKWKHILGWKVGDKVKLLQDVEGIYQEDAGFLSLETIKAGAIGEVVNINCFGDVRLLAVKFNNKLIVYGLSEKAVVYVEKES